MAQQTLINGDRFSFTSISVNMAGRDEAKGTFKSVNYTGTQEPGVVQGNAVMVTGLTAGYFQGAGDFEMLVAELDAFLSYLTNDGDLPILGIDFDMVVSYAENDVDVRTDTLQGCRITEISSSNTQGTDGTTKTCKLFIRRIFLNGLAMAAEPTS